MKLKSRPQDITELDLTTELDLILYNDDFNTFDFVIGTLVDEFNHDYLQAVQIAHIVHNNEKCSIKKGFYNELKPKYDSLFEKGLSVRIE